MLLQCRPHPIPGSGQSIKVSDWLACQVSTSSSATLLVDSMPADSHSQHEGANNKIVLPRLPLLHPLKKSHNSRASFADYIYLAGEKFHVVCLKQKPDAFPCKMLMHGSATTNNPPAWITRNITSRCEMRTAKSRTCVSSSELFVICSQVGRGGVEMGVKSGVGEW